MKIKNISIKKLKPAEYNPRMITDEELNKLKASIKEFGFVQPVIVNHDMTVISGHQRLKAYVELCKGEVPCVVLHLNKTKEKILNLALNKISGAFDDIKLQQILQELTETDGINLAATGFDTKEIDEILNSFDEDENQIKNWELDEIYIPFWIVIRGPIENIGAVKEALQKIKNIPGIKIEASA